MANNIADSIYKGIEEFYEYDARGLGTTANITSDTGGNVKAKFIEIPTPAWFPDSFIRSLKRNSYFNMVNSASFKGDAGSTSEANDKKSLDFYMETNTGMLEGLVHTAVKSIISTASNQIMSITSKVDSLVNGVQSLFSDGDKKSNSTDFNILAKEPFLAAQPYLNIKGIHLTESLRDNLYVLQRIIRGASDIINSYLKSKITSKDFDVKKFFKTPLSEKFKKSLVNALSKITKLDFSGDFESAVAKLLTTDDLRMHNFAEVCMDASLSGTYTMSCRLPFFGNKQAIMSSNNASSTFTTPFSFSNDGTQEFLKKATGLATAWSNPIKWKPESLMATTQFTPVSYDFDIFNDTLEHTLINLYFIWSFGALSKPVTDTFFIRPPYLYDIEIPGGFRYKYCSLDLDIKPVGKIRKIASSKVTPSFGSGGDDFLAKLFKETFGYAVNPKAIEYIPDCYNVSITFRSLLPDLWNYMDSYLHQSEISPAIGTHLQTLLAYFTYNFKEE